jgi:lambda repressor-like predicted transcriptional regulator
MNNKEIKNIEKLLEVQERSGAWLARRCGVSRQNVHHWLRGSNIPLKYRPIIAAAFGVRQEMIW